MTVIAIPRILTDRLTAEGAEALVSILDKVEDRTQKAVLEIAEERFEKRLAQLEARLETKIAEAKAEIIKWIFLFWVGQIVTITGIFYAFLKK